MHIIHIATCAYNVLAFYYNYLFLLNYYYILTISIVIITTFESYVYVKDPVSVMWLVMNVWYLENGDMDTNQKIGWQLSRDQSFILPIFAY